MSIRRVVRPNLTGMAKTQQRRVDHTRRGAFDRTSRLNYFKVPVLRSQLCQHDTVVLRADNCKVHYHFGSSVGIATDYGLDGPGSNPGGDEIFRPSRLALGPTQPPVPGTRSFPG